VLWSWRNRRVDLINLCGDNSLYYLHRTTTVIFHLLSFVGLLVFYVHSVALYPFTLTIINTNSVFSLNSDQYRIS